MLERAPVHWLRTRKGATRTQKKSPFAEQAQRSTLALRVIPAASREGKAAVNLAATMHSLVLSDRSPIALEIVGTHTQRSFVIRATTKEALAHVAAQLQVRYPQAELTRLEESSDPLLLQVGEEVSAIELLAGAPSHLPLQNWEREMAQRETDPLLGLLATLDNMPQGMRAITQIALVPVEAAWLQRQQQRIITQVRMQENSFRMTAHGETGPHPAMLLLGGGLLALLLLYSHNQQKLPRWEREAIHHLIQGKMPQLSAQQQWQLYGALLIVALASGVLFLCVQQISQRFFAAPMYNLKQVERSSSRVAYRVRLRLYVITQTGMHPMQNDALESLTTAMASARIWWRQRQGERRRKQERQAILERLIAAYRQYHLVGGNYFVPRSLSSAQARRCLKIRGNSFLSAGHAGWWQGVRHSRHLMSMDTLAALWHIPSAQALPEMAQIEQRRAHSRLVPTVFSTSSSGYTPMGFSTHAGHRLPFFLPSECLSRHMLIGGKSGEGKSTCLQHLAHTAMQQGGLVVIDPHGDLAEQVLRLVPAHRGEDVVWIDLSQTERAVGFNPLDVTLSRGRDKTIADLLKTLSHIWITSWGPRMEIAFEYALRTLFEANLALCSSDRCLGPSRQYTLLDVMPLLTDESFCHALLGQIHDPYLRRWWATYYDPLSLPMQRDRVDPVLSKVAKFESQIARRIIGQGQSTLDFTECIQQEKIVLVKLAKGVVGEDIARLLGATLLGLLHVALEEQGAVTQEQRKRLCIMIDEFQTLKGVDWAALAELRKYGAAFYLATQSLDYLNQVHERLLPTVLANVKQLIIFHMSAQDAKTIHQEIDVEPEDIVHLDSHMCYIKLTYENRRQPTFSATLSLPPVGDERQAESIRQECLHRYAVPATTVDAALTAAVIRTIASQPKVEAGHHPSPKRPQKAVELSSRKMAGTKPLKRQISEETSKIKQVEMEVNQPSQGRTDAVSVLPTRPLGRYRGRKSQEQGKRAQTQKRNRAVNLPMPCTDTLGSVLAQEEGGSNDTEE